VTKPCIREVAARAQDQVLELRQGLEVNKVRIREVAAVQVQVLELRQAAEVDKVCNGEVSVSFQVQVLEYYCIVYSIYYYYTGGAGAGSSAGGGQGLHP